MRLMTKTFNSAALKPVAVALAASGIPLSASSLRRHLREGRLVAQRIGGRWYCSPDAIREALVQEIRP